MAKRAREDTDVGGSVEAVSEAPVPPNAAAVASSAAAPVAPGAECEFCLREFQPRGLKIHQSRCKAKANWHGPPPLPLQPQQVQQHPVTRSNKKQKRSDEVGAFLETLSPEFAAFARSDVHLKRASKAKLEECKPRFDELMEALKQRGVEIPVDSRLCSNYVGRGMWKLEHIVDSTEEREFLLTHTNYSATTSQYIEEEREELQEEYDGWLPSEEDDMMVAEVRENAKARLCVEFLLDNKGLALPRKWGNCRGRLEEVRAAGGIVKAKRAYIYKGQSDAFIDSDSY